MTVVPVVPPTSGMLALGGLADDKPAREQWSAQNLRRPVPTPAAR
jgi:hypothetical protein